MFTIKVGSVGNPDHAQYHGGGVLSPTLTLEARTLPALSKKVRAYIEKHELGSGNFVAWPVERGGSVVGDISYNGRFWPARFRVEVQTGIDPKWYGNALMFTTREAADTYGLDLSCRWTSVRDYRVVEEAK